MLKNIYNIIYARTRRLVYDRRLHVFIRRQPTRHLLPKSYTHLVHYIGTHYILQFPRVQEIDCAVVGMYATNVLLFFFFFIYIYTPKTIKNKRSYASSVILL